MSSNLLPPTQPSPTGPSNLPAPVGAEFGGMAPGGSGLEEQADGVPWHRLIGAVKRYKWLMMAIILMGAALGVFVSRLLPGEYSAAATVWVASAPTLGGPVRGQEVLGTQGWAELPKSFTVLDAVVQDQHLYIKANSAGGLPSLDGMAVGEIVRPGAYVLQKSADGTSYTLKGAKDSLIEQGKASDSVGRAIGLRWVPGAANIPSTPVKFTLMSTRQASARLLSNLDVDLPRDGNFMRLTLLDDNPDRVYRSLNSILDHFVVAAVDLKAFKLRETSRILQEQLTSVGAELRNAEARLENYKTQIITLPSEATPVAPGLQMTQSTAIGQYFNEKIELERLQRERVTLGNALSAATSGSLNTVSLMAIDAVGKSPDLLKSLNDLTAAETELRALQTKYTDQSKPVLAAQEKLTSLRDTIVPTQLSQTVASVDSRIQELQGHLASASRELQSIPTRVITEQRLDRERLSVASIYTDLQARYQAARLAEATAIPDVKILDRAGRPNSPTKNNAPRLILAVFFASVGAAFGLALLLDMLDRRVQYPEQVTRSLGLSILGAVPALKRARRGDLSTEQASQFIEAFRTVRVNLAHSLASAGPLKLTITSPNAGDGKSLVSANLAVSFASAGYQTILIDGDTRRGELHRMFGIDRRPGLLDYLQGEATLAQIVRPSSQPGLWVIPCGTRRQHAPELIGSSAMQVLLQELEVRFNAILMDSPPLGAGVDAYVLGAATGSLALVIRSGETDRHLAEAKLSLVDRLPIRVLGAVLNDVRAGGAYRYYSYLYGYSASDEGSGASELPAGESQGAPA